MPSDDEEKSGLFNKLKGAMGHALSGPMAPNAGTGAPARRPAPPPAGRGDRFSTSTQPLNLAAPTAKLGTQPKAPSQGPSEEELSPRRLAMIEDFLRGDFKIEQMRDPAYMYKIVSDERAHQTKRLMALRRQANAAQGEQAEALNAQIKRAQTTVQNLFRVLKRITGKEGRTGGTDFLHEHKEPPT